MKKYEIVYEKIKADILNGYLHKDEKIPSIRQSCNLFHMSQTTIEKAYDKLVLDGYIKSLPQIGYIVKFTREQIRLHREIEKVQNEEKEDVYTYDFRIKSVSKDSFEMDTWKRYLKEVMNNKESMSMYGMAQGEPELRQVLSRYAYKNRGILSHPDQMLVGSNYQSLLFILCGMMDKNLIVGMEEDAPLQTKRVFEAYGFKIIFLSRFNFMEDLKNNSIDILYITPACFGNHKEPISSRIADELLVYSASQNILIVEDDYNGELTYRSSSRQALHSLSIDDNVIYLGSFSRLLIPSFRISYMILNEKYTNIYKAQEAMYGPTASKIEQLAFVRYIQNGYLEKHLRKLKKEYKEKSEYMEYLLKKYTKIPFYLNEAYMSYCNEDLCVKDLKLKCEEKNIGITYSNKGIEIGFANISMKDMEQGIVQLIEIIEGVQ